MSYVAVAIGGTAVLGAYASNQAANAQSAAANNANNTQMAMYQQQRADNEPWRQTGADALSHIAKYDFMNNWQTDPGYQFRLDQGTKAIGASASARGMNQSGATMKALARYGQDYASGEYNNVYNRQYNRLSSLAGFGQGANNQNNAAGANYANQSGANSMGAANAQAANYMNQANNLSNAANSYANYQTMNNYLNKKGG